MSSIPPAPGSDSIPPPPARQFDFARPLAFVFDDREWLPKVLLGGLFYLACFVLVGIPFVMGYAARTAKNVIDGKDTPLPGWSDLGGIFADGIKVSVVAFLYLLPQFFICFMWVFGSVVADRVFRHEGPAAIMGCAFLFFIPFFIVLYLLMPVALVRVVATGRFEAGFELPTIIGLIGKNLTNYILAILVHIVAGFVAQFGVILLCVGVFFTAFWAILATAHAFGQVYRLSEVK